MQTKPFTPIAFTVQKVPDAELEQIYKTGLGNKVVRIKSSSALKNGFVLIMKRMHNITMRF